MSADTRRARLPRYPIVRGMLIISPILAVEGGTPILGFACDAILESESEWLTLSANKT